METLKNKLPDFRISPHSNKAYLLSVASFIIALFYFSLTKSKTDFTQNQIIIWGLGPLVALFAFILYLEKSFKFPREGMLLIYFQLSCLLGLLVVENVDDYMRYYRLLLTELGMFLVVLVAIYTHRGEYVVIIALFIACGIAILDSFINSDFQEAIYSDNIERESGIFKNSNGFAIFARYCIIAGVFIFINYKNVFYRLAIMGIMALCVYASVAAGSRGNLITLGIIFASSFILLNAKDNKLGMFILLAIFAFGVQFFISEIMPDTSIGRRMESTSEKGIENESRFIIIANNLEIWWSSPLFGVGLKQLRALDSGMSHNEPIEILATTGFIGFAIYYSIYWVFFKRMRKITKYYEVVDKSKWKNIQVLWIMFINHLAFLPFDVSFLNPLSFTFLSFMIALSYYYERNMEFQQKLIFESSQENSVKKLAPSQGAL